MPGMGPKKVLGFSSLSARLSESQRPILHGHENRELGYAHSKSSTPVPGFRARYGSDGTVQSNDYLRRRPSFIYFSAFLPQFVGF